MEVYCDRHTCANSGYQIVFHFCEWPWHAARSALVHAMEFEICVTINGSDLDFAI